MAVKLPDPLANLFVPLEVEAWGFEGAVSMRDGLTLEASFDASSTDAAEKLAGIMQQQAPTLPPLARGLQATSDRRTVSIQLQASQAEVVAAPRRSSGRTTSSRAGSGPAPSDHRCRETWSAKRCSGRCRRRPTRCSAHGRRGRIGQNA